MFDFCCDACHRRVVLFASQIKQVVNDEQGIVLVVRCWCGELGAMRTGAKARTTARAAWDLAS
ncbi:MAG TPA: hypothetical protein VFJ19_19335 [Nocardioidaceae bacterium]|nr:hypothetical protein [Nocardioidaceae bacterium]